MSTTFERNALLTHARNIVDAAKADGDRDLTKAEAAEVERDMASIRALDAKPKSINYWDQISAMSRVPNGQVNDGAGGSSSDFFTAEAKSGVLSAIKSRTAFRAELPAKAALVSNAVLPTSGVGIQGGLHPSQFPLASLFVNTNAEGPTQRYYRFTSGTAGVVAEAGLKPDAGVLIDPVDLALTKLACTAQFSDEMAEDAPYLVNHLQTELSAAVLAAENASILATFAATSGVLTATSTTAAVIDTLADAVGAAESLSGITPSAIIAHPTVVAVIRKGKASTSGVYNIDPLGNGQPTSVHGVQMISTPAVAPGVAWVVDPSGVIVYRRGPLVVEVGTSNSDWNYNLRTMRAEERMATAVLRPSSLSKITLT